MQPKPTSDLQDHVTFQVEVVLKNFETVLYEQKRKQPENKI